MLSPLYCLMKIFIITKTSFMEKQNILFARSRYASFDLARVCDILLVNFLNFILNNLNPFTTDSPGGVATTV